MTVDLTQHSPLGGSGAHRWVPCPGSVRLSHGVEDPESEYALAGIAAHSLGETCLKNGDDAWGQIGNRVWNNYIYDNQDVLAQDNPNNEGNEIEINRTMADAVQVYLDAFRGAYPRFHDDENGWVELEFHCPGLHKYFWGKSDAGFWDEPERTLHVWDYKHGVGVVVEVPWNPQLMYYACGILEYLKLWDEIDRVVLWVAQPNGFHGDGPIRSWSISAHGLRDWLHEVLIPAMDRALTSDDTASGPHCRFCPARARACPQIFKDTQEFEAMVDKMDLSEKNAARKLSNQEVAHFLDLGEVVKIAAKAAERTAFARAEAGHDIPGRKLVKARSRREWREGEEAQVRKALGKKAMTKPELLSPAKAEKLPGGEKVVARHAFKPDAGRTLVRDDDSRPSMAEDNKSLFEKETQKRKSK